MLKKLFYLSALLLLCSSCVSRTVYKEPGLRGHAGQVTEKKIIWFWDKEY